MTRTVSAMALALCLVASAVSAADYTAGDISVTNTWSRATPRGAEVAGAYMTVTNKGTTADRLLGGSSPAAARLEFHTMSMEQGVMKMRPVQGGIEIKPGATVEFKPQSFHIMLVGLKKPLKQGEHVKATLQFEKGGKLDVEYAVAAMGATGPAAGGSMGHMDHMDHMQHGAPAKK